ncbi:MAG: SCO1664 family protein [Actinomycetia bacterium]|nr:SCO1664 family protein [Actinomycetes bacterium]
MTAAPAEHTIEALTTAELSIEGRILVSSNAALLVSFTDPAVTESEGVAESATLRHAIYKPIARERPLWDYPDGTLAGRERAAYLISELGGWGVIPPTVLRDGPLGSGAVQLWVNGESDSVVDIVRPGRTPQGWRAVIEGADERGAPVVLAHAADPATRAVAVLDLVLNTSDRKGSHLIRDAGDDRHVWGVDHGVSLGVEPKVRTVLWGFVGEAMTEADLAPVRRLRAALEQPVSDELVEHLTQDELAALVERIDEVLESALFPGPNEDWPAVPWPAL